MDQAAYFNQMREKRKHEILTAARKMLLKDGTASFTMQKLAKKLDISTVTLYKYFKKKFFRKEFKSFQYTLTLLVQLMQNPYMFLILQKR